MEFNQSIVETFNNSQAEVTFSSYGKSLTLSIDGPDDQAVNHVLSRKSEYKAGSTELTGLFDADMATAKAADERCAQAKKAKESLEETQKNMKAELDAASAAISKNPFAKELGIESISSINDLNTAISKLEQRVADEGKKDIRKPNGQQIFDKNGKRITVDQYIKEGARLDAEIAKGEEVLNTEDGVTKLEQKKAELEKKLEETAKADLEKLSTAYGKLKDILTDFALVAKENGDIDSTKKQLKPLKDTQNEDRNFFQKMFGTGLDASEKSDRNKLKGRIDTEKQEASAAKKAFVEKYGAKPTENFKKQVTAQINNIALTVNENPTLKALAEKYKFEFTEIKS